MNKLNIFNVSVLIALVLMLSSVSAASMQLSVGTYDTDVYKNSQFSVPVSVTLDNGTGTATVTLSPKNGLSCDPCTSNVAFDSAGTKSTSITLYADNAGSYESPFTVQATMAGVSPGSKTATNTILVSEMPAWTLDFSKSSSSVVTGGTVTLTLSIDVTDQIEGITADLTYPSSGWAITSGSESYTIGTVTGTHEVSWILSATSPAQSNTFSVDIISTSPSKADTKTLSVTGPSPPSNGGGDTPSGTSPSFGGSIPPADTGNKNATDKPTILPGTGLMNNTKLQAALEKVLSIGNMDQNAIDNMQRISSTISSEIEIERYLEVSSGKSDMDLSIKYNGKNKLTNFVVYDTIPKEFAESAKNITVIAPGATVEVVEDDPEYAIIFSSLTPGETVNINYIVNEEVDVAIVSSFSSEVYASAIETTTTNQICAQVITPAKNQVTGDCIDYPTPCDVPEGWDIVDSCDAIVTGNVIEDEPKSKLLWVVAIIVIVLVGYFSFVMSRIKKNKEDLNNFSDELHSKGILPNAESKATTDSVVASTTETDISKSQEGVVEDNASGDNQESENEKSKENVENN